MKGLICFSFKSTSYFWWTLLNHVGIVFLAVCLLLKRRRRRASGFLSAPAPLRHHEVLNKKTPGSRLKWGWPDLEMKPANGNREMTRRSGAAGFNEPLSRWKRRLAFRYSVSIAASKQPELAVHFFLSLSLLRTALRFSGQASVSSLSASRSGRPPTYVKQQRRASRLGASGWRGIQVKASTDKMRFTRVE